MLIQPTELQEAVSAKSELQQRAERVEARLQGLQVSASHCFAHFTAVSCQVRGHLGSACTRSEEHLPVLQESLDAMLKENTRLRSDAEFQQRKLDWLSEKLQEAEHNENQARRAAKEVASWQPACI